MFSFLKRWWNIKWLVKTGASSTVRRNATKVCLVSKDITVCDGPNIKVQLFKSSTEWGQRQREGWPELPPLTDHRTQQWLEPLGPRFKEQGILKKISGSVCVCVFGYVKRGWDHTKTMPGHVSEAGMNGAFWLVREGKSWKQVYSPIV